ncbi:MAG: hypothetical protein GXO81_03045 [Chlorobi bacterium]|nr:hypothetical protein [Chlorobiota bacterium]
MLKNKRKIWDQVGSALYDLTHLEINTIIKEDMTTSKASNSPRILLHEIAKKYSFKLTELGEKYANHLAEGSHKNKPNLFRGRIENEGSGYKSFRELSSRAKDAYQLLKDNKSTISLNEEEIDSDMMMLQRIEMISDDLRNLLKSFGEHKPGKDFDFDNKDTISKFRAEKGSSAEKHELDVDLRQLMVIRKAHDVGTERVVLQTIIGMDGDVTTRVSKSFAYNPVTFINEMHERSVTISINYWKALVKIISEFGQSLLKIKKK